MGILPPFCCAGELRPSQPMTKLIHLCPVSSSSPSGFLDLRPKAVPSAWPGETKRQLQLLWSLRQSGERRGSPAWQVRGLYLGAPRSAVQLGAGPLASPHLGARPNNAQAASSRQPGGVRSLVCTIGMPTLSLPGAAPPCGTRLTGRCDLTTCCATSQRNRSHSRLLQSCGAQMETGECISHAQTETRHQGLRTRALWSGFGLSGDDRSEALVHIGLGRESLARYCAMAGRSAGLQETSA
jgi:hypothetical protein